MRLGIAMLGELGPAGLNGRGRTVDVYSATALWRAIATVLDLHDWDLVASEPPGFHPGRTMEVRLAGQTIGHLGEFHPTAVAEYGLEGRVAGGELDLVPLLAERQRWVLEEPSIYPPADFDLAFIVPSDVTAAALIARTKSASELVENVRLFDQYLGAGEGTKSLAFHYRLRAPDRTLVADDIAKIRALLVEAAAALGARLRT